MDNTTREVYRVLLDSMDVPPGIVRLHDRFLQVWERLGRSKHGVPGEILALIIAMAEDEEVRAGHPVRVDGKSGKFVSKWKGDTVRVKFPGDDKKFRVIPAGEVHYE